MNVLGCIFEPVVGSISPDHLSCRGFWVGVTLGWAVALWAVWVICEGSGYWMLDVGVSGNGEGVVSVNVRLVGIVFYARCVVRRWFVSRTGVGGDSGRKLVVLRASSESVDVVAVPLPWWGIVGAVQFCRVTFES